MAKDHGQRIHKSRPEAGQEVQLSCQACHRRKTRCDKLVPTCTSCQQSGVTCVPVQRARLPRGRVPRSIDQNSEKESDLRNRVRMLEQQMKDLNSSRSPDHVDLQSSRYQATAAPISGESPALQSISVNSDGLLPTHNDPAIPNFVPFMRNYFTSRQQDPISTVSGQLHEDQANATLAESETDEQLLHLYFEQVDPVFKILHRSSLIEYLIDGKPYLGYDLLHPAPRALAAAVRFASVSSLSKEQCIALFGTSKDSMVLKYQNEVEDALARVDFIITNDMTVLQAFVLSLVATQCQERSRRVWTMLSLALRIGQAISLHLPDSAFPLTSFEREMRKRLWIGIGLLDVQASLDRASEPMMQSEWLQHLLPSNVNDSDIEYHSEMMVALPETIFTDTTFTLVVHHSQFAVRSLNFTDFSEPVVGDGNKRQNIVTDFRQKASKLLSDCQSDQIPFHWYTEKFAEYMHAVLQLIALRPVQRHPKFLPPMIRDAGLLKLAVQVLQAHREISLDPRGTPWRWFGALFLPWHALAVAAAEICGQRDAALYQVYWPIIEQVYSYFEGLETDSKQEMLWHPMKRLMRQAQAQKDALFEAPAPAKRGEIEFGEHSVATLDFNAQDAGFSSQTTGTTFGPLVMDSSFFELMDFGNVADDFLSAAAWSNYESFIADVHESGEPLTHLYGSTTRQPQ